MVVYYYTLVLSFLFAKLSAMDSTAKSVFEKKSSKLSFYLVLVLFVFVSGFRWQVGTDYGNYVFLYSRYTQEFMQRLSILSEPGLVVIAKISSYFYDDYSSMFFLAAFITLYLMIRTIYKYSDNVSLSILLFVLLGVFHLSFNAVRQCLAMSIIFASHNLIFDKKFFRYFLTILLATIFHISALFMLPLFFFPTKKESFKKNWWLFMLPLVIVAILTQFGLMDLSMFFTNADFVDSPYYARKVNILRIIPQLLPLALFYFVSKKNSTDDKFYFYLSCHLALLMLSIISLNSAYLWRFGLYLFPFTVLLVPKIFNFNDRLLILISKLCLLVVYSIFWQIDVQSSPNLSNFSWIFQR